MFAVEIEFEKGVAEYQITLACYLELSHKATVIIYRQAPNLTHTNDEVTESRDGSGHQDRWRRANEYRSNEMVGAQVVSASDHSNHQQDVFGSDNHDCWTVHR